MFASLTAPLSLELNMIEEDSWNSRALESTFESFEASTTPHGKY
jgi:hypothetical protein